jgi:hypothetical protein
LIEDIYDITYEYANDVRPFLNIKHYIPYFIDFFLLLPPYEPGTETDIASMDNLGMTVNKIEPIVKENVDDFSEF